MTVDLQANGEVDPTKQAAQIRRKATIDGRIGVRLPSGSSTGATTSVSELINLRSNVGKSAQFAVFVQFRLSNKPGSIDKSLGTTCRPYPETTTLFGKFCVSCWYNHLSTYGSFAGRHRKNCEHPMGRKSCH